MGLTDEQIQELLNKPEKPVRAKRGGIDYTTAESRSYENWFKLAHHLMDQETQEPAKCENPNCIDQRERQDVVALIQTSNHPEPIKLCRICFVDGYGVGTGVSDG